MTKTDYRIPRPTYRRPDDVPVSLRELMRRLSRDGYVQTSELGALAMLSTVGTSELGDGAVTLAKIAGIASQRILGRVSGGSGAPEELTGTQATTLLDAFTSGLKGLAPASGGGTTNFLRADGSWAAPVHPVTTAVLGSDHSIASTTATEVTGLQATLTAGTYTFEYTLICQTTSTGVGLALGINYTGTSSRFVAARTYFTTGSTAANGTMVSQFAPLTGALVEHAVTRTLSTTAPNLGPNTGFAGANVDCLTFIKGVIQVSDGGDLELWHASETATSTSVESGSTLVVTKAA